MAINPPLNETHDDYVLYEFRTYHVAHPFAKPLRVRANDSALRVNSFPPFSSVVSPCTSLASERGWSSEAGSLHVVLFIRKK